MVNFIGMRTAGELVVLTSKISGFTRLSRPRKVPDAGNNWRAETSSNEGQPIENSELAVFSELTVEIGCPRQPVAPSNREFPLP